MVTTNNLEGERGEGAHTMNGNGSTCQVIPIVEPTLAEPKPSKNEKSIMLSVVAQLEKSTLVEPLILEIKKDTVVKMIKRQEQERQRQEKLAETSRTAKYRCHNEGHSRSRSPLRYRPSKGRSPRRHYTHSRSPRVHSRSRY